MRKTATTIRCAPRLGIASSALRVVDIDIYDPDDDRELYQTLSAFFESRGIAEAIFDMTWDDEGCLAIINDEAFDYDWGSELN